MRWRPAGEAGWRTVKAAEDTWWWSAADVELTLAPLGLEAGRQYELCLDAAAPDEAGEPLGFPWCGLLRTGHRPPRFNLVQGDGVLEWDGPRRLPLASTNVLDYRVIHARIEEEQLAGLLAPRRGWGARPEPESLPAGAQTAKLAAPSDARLVSPLELDPVLGGRPGIVWSQVQAGAVLSGSEYNSEELRALRAPRSAITQVTGLGLTVKSTWHEGLLVWVTRLKDGAPVGGAIVRARDAANRVLWEGTSDANGLARTPPDIGAAKPWYGEEEGAPGARPAGDEARPVRHGPRRRRPRLREDLLVRRAPGLGIQPPRGLERGEAGRRDGLAGPRRRPSGRVGARQGGAAPARQPRPAAPRRARGGVRRARQPRERCPRPPRHSRRLGGRRARGRGPAGGAPRDVGCHPRVRLRRAEEVVRPLGLVVARAGRIPGGRVPPAPFPGRGDDAARHADRRRPAGGGDRGLLPLRRRHGGGARRLVGAGRAGVVASERDAVGWVRVRAGRFRRGRRRGRPGQEEAGPAPGREGGRGARRARAPGGEPAPRRVGREVACAADRRGRGHGHRQAALGGAGIGPGAPGGIRDRREAPGLFPRHRGRRGDVGRGPLPGGRACPGRDDQGVAGPPPLGIGPAPRRRRPLRVRVPSRGRDRRADRGGQRGGTRRRPPRREGRGLLRGGRNRGRRARQRRRVLHGVLHVRPGVLGLALRPGEPDRAGRRAGELRAGRNGPDPRQVALGERDGPRHGREVRDPRNAGGNARGDDAGPGGEGGGGGRAERVRLGGRPARPDRRASRSRAGRPGPARLPDRVLRADGAARGAPPRREGRAGAGGVPPGRNGERRAHRRRGGRGPASRRGDPLGRRRRRAPADRLQDPRSDGGLLRAAGTRRHDLGIAHAPGRPPFVRHQGGEERRRGRRPRGG